jgi:hypothetical protein
MAKYFDGNFEVGNVSMNHRLFGALRETVSDHPKVAATQLQTGVPNLSADHPAAWA